MRRQATAFKPADLLHISAAVTHGDPDAGGEVAMVRAGLRDEPGRFLWCRKMEIAHGVIGC